MVWMVVAAIYGATAVIAGAFGAHGLRDTLAPEQLSAWNTATLYHLLHSVALLALGLYGATTGRSVALPAVLFARAALLGIDLRTRAHLAALARPGDTDRWPAHDRGLALADRARAAADWELKQGARIRSP